MTIFAGFPEILRIGPFDYRVKIVKKLKDWGEFSSRKCVIRLRSKMSPAWAIDTVKHEISHAIWHTYHLKRGDGEERIVTVMATGWTQVYRNNPKLLKWIAATARKK